MISRIMRSMGSASKHNHAEHSIPEGSWHRHTDDEDYLYFYNKYGPFHHYTILNHGNPDIHNIPEEDPYRHEPQGYIQQADQNDNRADSARGATEAFIAVSMIAMAMFILPRRHYLETEAVDKKIGDALITAQEIEDFIEEAKKKLK